MTQIRDKKTLEATATYSDAVKLIEDMIIKEIKESEVEEG